MKIDEREFREFITWIDEFIHRPVSDPGDIRPAILANKIANKVKGYKIILQNIDHNSSKKFKQLKLEYGKEEMANNGLKEIQYRTMPDKL